MLDAQILSASIADRQAFERIAAHLSSKDMTPAVGFWFDLVKGWYARDGQAKSVDIPALAALGESRITQPKQRESILAVIKELPAAVSPDNTAQVALELKRRNTGLELAAAIASGDEKKTALLVPVFTDLRAATSLVSTVSKPEWQDAVPIRDIFKHVGRENRVPLAPARINSHIGGGALPGHHVIVFARPEMGKSTFAINEAVVLAANGQRVLYVGNEDQIDILKSRALCRVSGMSLTECEAAPDRAFAEYERRGLEDRLLFSKLSSGTVDALRRRIEEWEPTILVVDQLRHLESTEDGLVARLEANANAVRKILSDYAMIGFSVMQAGATAEGKVWLDMTDLADSKTGVPGTGDLIIGIGGNADMVARGQRSLSFPKNKLSSDSNAHEGVMVEVDLTRSKFS